MKIGQNPDNRIGQILSLSPVWHFGVRDFSVVEDGTVHVIHHVERRIVDSLIFAEAEALWNGNRGPADCRDYAMLPAHIVRRRQDKTERWAAQYHVSPVGRGDLKGQV